MLSYIYIISHTQDAFEEDGFGYTKFVPIRERVFYTFSKKMGSAIKSLFLYENEFFIPEPFKD